MRLIRVSFLTLTFLLSQSLYANEKRRFQVDIQGLQYQAVVTENIHLISKVSGIDEEVRGHHYIGVLDGEESSWVRASYVNGYWQGVVSVHNAMHIIQHAGAEIPVGAAATTSSIMHLCQ